MTKRTDCIRASGIRNIFEKAAGRTDLVNLSIGQPDFSVPSQVKEGMIKAINEDKTGYTQSAGLDSLRKKILDKYGLKGFDCIMTVGVSGGLFLSYSTLLEEGDEIIVFDPYFVIYPDLAGFLGGKSVLVRTNDDFSVNIDGLKKKVTKKTKAIIINSPNNPTGHVMDKDELQQVVDVAKENDLWLISDEVYSDFDYEDKFKSVAGMYDKIVILSGYSKTYSMTGLRLGYAVAPKEIVDDMIKLQQYTFVCAPSIAQHAVDENFDVDVSEMVDVFKKRRDMVYDALKDSFEIVKPEGAFYMLLKLPKGFGGDEFAEKCLDKGLLVVPGSAFGDRKDYIRISYAVDEEELKKGIEILKGLAE